VFGLQPVRLDPGDPADLVLIDPDAGWTVEPERFQSKGRNTPFAGWRLTGRALATICGGRLTHVDPAVAWHARGAAPSRPRPPVEPRAADAASSAPESPCYPALMDPTAMKGRPA